MEKKGSAWFDLLMFYLFYIEITIVIFWIMPVFLFDKVFKTNFHDRIQAFLVKVAK